MTIFEIVSVAGLFLGPIFAVAITLWNQRVTRIHDRRIDVARKLLDTHHDAGERDYSSAIRLVPIEFRHDARVLDAWRSIMENVSHKPAAENKISHNSQFLDRKFRLIFEVCRSVGIKLTESEIRGSVYEAQAYSDHKTLEKNTQQAIIRIADIVDSAQSSGPTLDKATGEAS